MHTMTTELKASAQTLQDVVAVLWRELECEA
jgi:hypothetical protein